jgi:hypothetical protein
MQGDCIGAHAVGDFEQRSRLLADVGAMIMTKDVFETRALLRAEMERTLFGHHVLHEAP